MVSGEVNLPMAILSNPHANLNNNFDGILEADSSSYESYSQEDSEIETYSDVELTDNSDDEILAADDSHDDGFYSQGYCGQEITGTRIKTDLSLAAENYVHQQNNNNENNQTIISDDVSIIRRAQVEVRPRGNGPVVVGEERSFEFKESEKPKSKLPGVNFLLQELAASAASWESHSWTGVVSHKCDKDCDCMTTGTGMYSAGYQSQNSF